MGRLIAVAAAALALCVPATAWAHTDSPRQLTLAWPAQGTVTSPFGDDNGRWHPGLDIGILRSLEVTAAAPGVVTEVGEPAGFDGYGNIVEVDLGGGFEALYAHLASWSVRVGEPVWAGEHLGEAGCTGWCTGTHLHFELREDGTAVDPTALMSGYNPG